MGIPVLMAVAIHFYSLGMADNALRVAMVESVDRIHEIHGQGGDVSWKYDYWNWIFHWLRQHSLFLCSNQEAGSSLPAYKGSDRSNEVE